MIRSSKFLAGLVVFAVVTSAVGSVGLSAGQFFRGFDMSDEAFVYSLSLAGGSLDRGWFFSYAYLTAPLFDLVGQQVWPMRVLRYLGYLLVCLLVAAGVIGVLQKLIGQTLVAWGQFGVISMAFLGSLWAWAYLPPVISYNELAVWFILMITAVLLLMESDWVRPAPWWPCVVIGLLAGVSQGLLFLAKLPSAIGVLILVIAYGVLTRRFSKKWLSFFCGYIGGVGATWGLLGLVGVPILEIARKGSLAVITGEGAPAGYETQGRLGEYVVTLQDDVIALRGPIAMFVIAVFVVYLISRTKDFSTLANSGSKILIVVVSVASLIWAWQLGVGQGGADSPFQIGFALTYFAAISLVLAALALTRVQQGNMGALLRVVVLLFAVVALAVIGTSNPITFQAQLIATPLLLIGVVGGLVWWFGKSGLNAPARFGFSLLASSVIVAISVFSFSIVWQGTWLDPYRQVPLAQQKSLIKTGILQGVRTDQNTALAAIELPLVAKELGLIKTPTTAWDNPGLVLFFNNSQFASSWQLPYVPTSTEELVQACKARPQTLVVLDDNSASLRGRGGDSEFFHEAVSECGATYPSQYQTVQKITQSPAGLDILVQLPTNP